MANSGNRMPAAERWRQAQMAEDFDNHRRVFDACPERVEGAAMIFKAPPQLGQCSISMSKTVAPSSCGVGRQHATEANQMYCGRDTDSNAVIKIRFIPIVIRKWRIDGTWYDENQTRPVAGTEMVRQIFSRCVCIDIET
jgi:hypothetical protein